MSSRNINSSSIFSSQNRKEGDDTNHLTDNQQTQKDNNAETIGRLKLEKDQDVYDTLSQLFHNKKYFVYCGSILININPGSNFIEDYLNLQKWLDETQQIPRSKWNPHLYSYINNIYQTMITDNKDQVVNLLGQTGSGKTFNVIHIIEYLSHLSHNHSHFDTIQRSIQLIHIIGSVYRENNPESSTCGMLFRLGFDKSHSLSSFDIEAKILDYTLPFSRSGRSFTLLHSLINGASSELKGKLHLTIKETYLNFFKKYNMSYSLKEKDAFRINDIEIWNRFHVLLRTFNFDTNEIINILQMFSLIINLSDIDLSEIDQIKKDNKRHFKFIFNATTKKIMRCLNIDEKAFAKATGIFHSEEDAKHYIKALMIFSYHMVFEYILQKIKQYLKLYFNNAKKKDESLSSLSSNRYIYIIDFPGQINDQTLGGFITNISYEYLNLFSCNSYLSLIEKMNQEAISIKQFLPLKSVDILQSLLGDKGIINYMSGYYSNKKYRQMKNNINDNKDLYNCIQFNSIDNDENYTFKCPFFNKDICYNYHTLHNEALTLEYGHKRISELLSYSSNIIISSTHRKVIQANFENDNNTTHNYIYSMFSKHIMKLLPPFILTLKPFIIYMLHSSGSYQMFTENCNQLINNLPQSITVPFINQSLINQVLYWEKYGYREWMDIERIISEYSVDLEKLQEFILSKRKTNLRTNSTRKLLKRTINNIEKVKLTMSLLSKENDYIIGIKSVLMRKGTLYHMRSTLNNMINNTNVDEINSSKHESTLSSRPYSNSISKSQRNQVKTKDIGVTSSRFSLNPKDVILDEDKRKGINLIRDTFSINIIETNSNIGNTSQNTELKCDKYNVYYFINKNQRNKTLHTTISNQEYQQYSNQMKVIDLLSINHSPTKISKEQNTPSINNNTLSSNYKNNLNSTQIINNKNKEIDYNLYISFIIAIQNLWRLTLSKRKFKKLKYINQQIIVIQSHFRKFFAKQRFNRFMYCLEKIIFIQRKFKEKFLMINLNNKKINTQTTINKKFLKQKTLSFRRKSNNNTNYVSEKSSRGKRIKKEIMEDKEQRGAALSLLFDDQLLKNNMEFNIEAVNLNGINGKLRRKIFKRSHTMKEVSNEQMLLMNKAKKKKEARVNELRDKKKEEEKNMLFVPRINGLKDLDIKTKYGSNFSKRTELYSLYKEHNLESLRRKKSEDENNEITFKPTISSFAQKMKRRLSNLYQVKEIQPNNCQNNCKEEGKLDNKTNNNEKFSRKVNDNTNRIDNNVAKCNYQFRNVAYHDYKRKNVKENNNMISLSHSISISNSFESGNNIWAIVDEKRFYEKK